MNNIKIVLTLAELYNKYTEHIIIHEISLIIRLKNCASYPCRTYTNKTNHTIKSVQHKSQKKKIKEIKILIYHNYVVKIMTRKML